MIERPRGAKLGCMIVVALIAVVTAISAFDSFWRWYQLGNPDFQQERIAAELPGFACPRLLVTKRVEPLHQNYDWGAMLAMPGDCRRDLRARAERSRTLKQGGDNCFRRLGRFSDRELCFEGEEVYFGGYRLP